ncbi:sigma-54-dependent transcriptional regulator [Marinobacter sp. BSs20148]|uniref:sigma-54-dependent transcriptional regulator n=1 Tax=Marinobacter sp. BSs20148 TaxID=490759 RepID=UPI00027767F1|nr:sigma-54 dependent transcriptional regulator [Marinobacter sp. BSs20148]AFP30186.1 Nitrogen regulation protein NR(I) [Marinobacter sp. BSs20148]
MARILIIDDDASIRQTLRAFLLEESHEAQACASVEEALGFGNSEDPELILLDVRLEGMSGLDGLLVLKAQYPDCRILIMTAHHDMESTIQAMQRGADDYLHKPLDLDELETAINHSLAMLESNSMNGGLDVPLQYTPGMIGSSPKMREIYKTIGLISSTLATVLITGESGTGKELIARAIHDAGERSSGPFVAVNCAALSENLIESEMFGHTKGAFTGAVENHPGKFTLAQGGTLFLDEIGELPLSLQAKLLRVLQEKEYSPLGSKNVLKADCRIIAATNIDLPSAIKAKQFREDLFYRLQIISIWVPSLRERPEEIPELVKCLAAKANYYLKSKVRRITPEALQCLQNYAWPGNVRELEHQIFRSITLSQSPNLDVYSLSDELQQMSDVFTESVEDLSLEQLSLADVERAHVCQVLDTTQGHRGKACDILGVSRPRLQRMIERFNLGST